MHKRKENEVLGLRFFSGVLTTSKSYDFTNLSNLRVCPRGKLFQIVTCQVDGKKLPEALPKSRTWRKQYTCLHCVLTTRKSTSIEVWRGLDSKAVAVSLLVILDKLT